MVEALRSANYFILIVATLTSFLWLFLRAATWRTLLRARASYWDVFHSLNEGYLLNSFLPFRLGELGRAFFLSRRSGLAFAEILPTIVIERAMDLVFSAALLLGSLPFVVGASGAERIAVILGMIVAIGIALLYLLARNDKWALDTFHKLSGRWPSIQRFGGNLLESFLTGLGALTDPRLFLRFLFWMILNWALAVFNYYLIIRAFFPQAQWIWGMFVLGATAFGNAIPAAPGALGAYEAAFGGALTVLVGKESSSIALAAAVFGHFLNYLTSLVLGGYAISREGNTLGGIYRELMALRTRTDQKE
ncbi:MAG: hypothetical protein HFACDABA_02989 [Anaerolineales bacterium]|nr:hypothetical protein [Anaerolineales bacterium]